MFYSIVIGLIVLISVLLVLVVLAQDSKGGGVTAQFGGSGASQMIGAKKTTDLLEKITWGLATGLLVLSLTTNLLITDNVADAPSNPNVDRAKERPGATLPQNLQPEADETGTGESDAGGTENQPEDQ